MIDVMEYILRRRSIRAYQPREVELEKLELLLQVAMAAPSARTPNTCEAQVSG